MMRYSILAAALLVGLWPKLTYAQTVVAPENLTLSATGTCESEAGRVDLGRAWWIENRELTTSDNRRIGLGRQSVGIELVESEPGRVGVYDMSTILAEEMQRDVDVELKFALLDGVLAIYWREPGFNRQYRQGLFRVEGASLVRWCQGMGGIYSSH